MRSVLQDLRFGLQLLSRNKLFSGVALVTLALCIGANTTIFSVINAVLLRPLPFPDSERLVILYNIYPNVGVDKGANGIPDYFDRREETEIFESLSLFTLGYYTLGSEGSPLRVSGLNTTPTLFSVLRAMPELGRPFTEAEGEIGNDQVVILGHDVWQEMFAGTPSIVGQEIRVDGAPREVVAVMPEGFELLSREVSVIVPLTFTAEQRSDQARHSNFATMVGRLRDGVDRRLAQQRIDALNQRNNEQFPEFRDLLENAGFATVVNGWHDEIVETIRPTLILLQAGVAFVLLIGCVNIANLLLMHATGRSQELAIRTALGAGRGRVARQLVTESVLLAGLGGLLGLAVGAAAVRALPLLGIEQLPGAEGVSLDVRATLFTLVTALGTGLVFGLVPAIQISRGSLEDVLRQGGRSGSSGRSAVATRSILVVTQVALAFVLLIGAGLMLTSFARILAVDPGFRPEQVFTTGVALPESRYDGEDEFRAFGERALERLESVAGVTAVGMSTNVPFSGNNNSSVITIDGQVLAPGESPPVPHFTFARGRYLEALGIPLLEGRFFEPTDTAEAMRVVVIGRRLADLYWPNESPLGKRLRQGVPNPEEMGVEAAPWATIIGIVGNIKNNDLAELDDVGTVYFSLAQSPQRSAWFIVRSELPEGPITNAVRREVQALDPELPLYFDTEMLETRMDRALVTRRAPMTLLMVFAGIALFLSAVGIYGVLAHSVTQRTKEIGIKMALGAEPNQVRLQTLWQGGRLVAISLLVGAAGAVWLGRLVSNLLYGVAPTDPGVFALVMVLLAAVALAACAIPSHRATRVNAVTALRQE
ncbi:MAG TPA: hypothetical protein DCP38_13185 [Acidobacteria bacterium]|jgi:predicted permease|nr:ABC transporter permease [Vicinamibacterales bacterium]HAK56412.1 hypothetical protein [Acidobacteriota bacterium]